MSWGSEGRVRSRRLGALGVAVLLALAAPACVAPPDDATVVDASVLDEPAPIDPGAFTVRIRSESCEGLGVGSGFLLDERTIVTNRHVVEGSDAIEVETSEGQSLVVDVVSQGLLADLAFVRLADPMDPAVGAATAVLAPSNPETGASLRAFGYPGGGPLTVTEGVVEDFEVDTRLGNLSKVIRSDVDIAPGSSGGPAVDDEGRVVGVVYAIERATELSLILPVETLQRLLANDEGLEEVEGGGC